MLGVLAGLGIDFVSDLIKDNGEDFVKEGIKKVTGIDLSKKKPTKEEIQQIREMEVAIKNQVLEDRKNARSHSIGIQNSNAPMWVKLNKTLTGQVTILLCFTLFFFVLSGDIDLQNSNVALIVGASIGYVSQILSFLFGSTEVDHNVKVK